MFHCGQRRFSRALGLMLVAAGLVFSRAADTQAQFGLAAPQFNQSNVGQDRAPQQFADGAALKTDPELERVLDRADQFAAEKRYDLACVLWQKVLDETGDVLTTRDGRTYTLLSERVERTLAELPSEGLRVYRITADGDARAVLAAAGDHEERALAEVVRRFFLSSHGDEAAYKLGCLALDRHDFVAASRLFAKILEQHPDPTPPRGELLLRLAVTSAFVGDRPETTAQLFQQAEQAPGARPSRQRLMLVQSDLQRAGAEAIGRSPASTDWPMALGNPARSGHMASLPASASESTLTELWDHEFPLGFTASPTTGNAAQGRIFFSGRSVISRGIDVATNTQQLIDRWREHAWSPTPQLLFSDGRLYFKTSDQLTCWNASGNHSLLWRSAWQNAFQLDSMTQMLAQLYMNHYRSGIITETQNRPVSSEEVMLFGDRVHQSMSLAGGLIYHLEGPRVGDTASTAAARQGMRHGTLPRRSRHNWLAAYEARSGRAKWRRSPLDSEQADDADMGFLAAPVPCGNLLLVPVTDGGTISMYALSPQDGKTIWKSYLCDEPTGGCSPWSAVGVAVEGSDAYVVCGAGVVFALDAATGSIRFAVRYPRNGKPNPMLRNYGISGGALLELNGWGEDVVIPYGRALVVIASDCDRLLAIDRRSGETLWESPRTPFDHPAHYGLGVAGRGLFVAGKNIVRRYDIPSGRLIWEQELGDSYGRGVLTADALYVPVKDSIVKLDLEKGRVQQQVGVSLSFADVSVSEDSRGKSFYPVGNLFSDGEKLWVVGANRVFALTDLQYQLALLEQQVAAGNVEAQLQRMRLLARLKKLDQAVEDLHGAYQKILAQKGAAQAATILLDEIAEIQLAQMEPQATLKILVDTIADQDAAAVPADVKKQLHEQRLAIAIGAVNTIRNKKVPRATGPVLALVSRLPADNLLAAAGQALTATVTDTDIPALREAVEGQQPAARIVAAGPLAKLLGSQAKDSLSTMTSATDDAVRLAGAKALANLGDRDSLPSLVELLKSDNPLIRLSSIRALRALTGKPLSFDPHGSAAKRAEEAKAWQRWLDSEGKTAKLIYPLPQTDVELGRTLICYYGSGLVVEVGSDGKERWRKNIPTPWACQGLPNGHRLIACYAQNMVVEFDEAGTEVWKKAGLPGNPFSVRRLDNGNTLISCSSAERVVEVRQDGSIAREISIRGRPTDARRLENGNTLIVLNSSGRVVEIDPSGNEIWQVTGLNGPWSAQRLESGNTLIVQTNAGKVVEVNREGTAVWSKLGLSQPYDAQRLSNGNTLIADNNMVQEIEPQGKQVWRRDQNGASGVSRF